MADLTDVENALVSRVTDAIYPNGTAQPSAIGTTCRIYRGWPISASLNSDLTAGITNITVFPSSIPAEILPPYLDCISSQATSLQLNGTVSGEVVTFSGAVTTVCLIGLIIDGRPYVYSAGTADTPYSIAANLAVMIQAQRLAALSGASVTIPGARTIVVRIVGEGSVTRQQRRQGQEVQIISWCPSTTTRDQVAALIDTDLSGTAFLPLVDGTSARIIYRATRVYDQSQNSLLYRRDLVYQCEYSIITIESASPMVVGDNSINSQSHYL